MSKTTAEIPEPWKSVLDERGLRPRTVEPPTEGDSADCKWVELYSRFETRGFVRALAAISESVGSIRVQFALPELEGGRDLSEAVRERFDELLGGSWSVTSTDPEYELEGRLEGTPDADSARRLLETLADLGEVAASGAPADVSWLHADSSESPRTGSDPRQSKPSRDVGSKEGHTDTSGAGVFESIGGGSSESDYSAALESAGIDYWELGEVDGEIEVRIRLDAPLPTNDVERLGRELAHALRSRYDISARPLPADDPDPDGGAELTLRARPADSGLAAPESADRVRADLEKYLDRIERFDELGVRVASVLGLRSGRSADESPRGESADRSDKGSSRKRGRGRREESAEASIRDRVEARFEARYGRDDESGRSDRSRDPEGDSRGRSDEAPSESSRSEEVVLDLDGSERPNRPEPTTDRKPESGLEPGNYRDRRLMRDDATTSLVDVVLRHPGYAEEKMGHNLSILLDVDFPDALDLVESAPSVIAWGVGRERALDFKRFIEDAGGRVVLVEPDSLKG